jgi:hypothetical protein
MYERKRGLNQLERIIFELDFAEIIWRIGLSSFNWTDQLQNESNDDVDAYMKGISYASERGSFGISYRNFE